MEVKVVDMEVGVDNDVRVGYEVMKGIEVRVWH